MERDRISLSFEANEELRERFATAQSGDSLEITVRGTILRVDKGGLTASIEEIVEEDLTESDDEAVPSSDVSIDEGY